ncbi:hypothetical protein [Derxia gummosa]|uniref:Uncharacterized protein n=1 Tax=Derxia gummosa DSM 723 TaxID=1121388 RepID=A0A8B6X2R8_9BURK|nr:hypothetical protein [Derxia gummosa]
MYANPYATLFRDLMSESARRLPISMSERAGERLDAAALDAGYCIDAPDLIPAGGCRYRLSYCGSAFARRP